MKLVLSKKKLLNNTGQIASQYLRYRLTRKEGVVIPRSTKATADPKPGETAEKNTDPSVKDSRIQDLEWERAVLLSDIDKKRLTAERDLLRATLEQERTNVSIAREERNTMEKLLFRIERKDGQTGQKPETAEGSEYVADLISKQALKRASADLARKLTIVDGLPKDARILIVDQLNYAAGDLPLVEISNHFGMVEARCRKQVADNRDLLDWVMQKEDKAEKEAPAPVDEAAKRFAFFAAIPAFTAAATALPSVSGLLGTIADIAGHFRSGTPSENIHRSLEDDILQTSIAGALRTEKRNIYLYTFGSLDALGTSSKLMKTYAGLIDCSSRLAKTRNQLSYFIEKKTAKLSHLEYQLRQRTSSGPETEANPETIREKIREETAWLNLAQPAVLASDAIHAELSAYIRAITTTDSPDGIPKLAQAVFRERVQDLGISHILFIGVSSSGGETVTKRSFFFVKSLSYFGGCVVSFALAKMDGEILASDAIPVLCVLEFRVFDNWIGPLQQVRFDRPELRK